MHSLLLLIGNRSCPRRAILLALAVIFQAGCQRKFMPTPNLYIDSESDPFAEVVPEYQSNTVDVLYATDRAIESAEGDRTRYGSGRSKALAFGSCIVEFGRDVAWDDLVSDSRVRSRDYPLTPRLRSITEQGAFPETPLRALIEDGVLRDGPEGLRHRQDVRLAFQEILKDRLAKTSRKEAFVYVHGIQNTFEDATMVMAELWHFFGREGVPIAYTWPAGGGGPMLGYGYDRESSDFTVHHLKNFIRTLASTPELEKIHIIAHSRGTGVVTNTLRELYIEARHAGADARDRWKIADVVLAAADIDFDVFLQSIVAERVGNTMERVTIYVSESDKALGAADWLMASVGRLGQLSTKQLPPEVGERLKNLHRVFVIDARVPTGFLGHSYFHQSPAVSSDLILLLRDNRNPGAENGRPLAEVSPGYWRIDKGYPEASTE